MQHSNVISSLLFVVSTLAAPAAEWRTRTIYQLLTDRFSAPGGPTCNDLHNYCGGTFAGIISNLDYIQSMGFDAIWISPVVANAPGGYHGYWQTNMYEVNPNFGAASDLIDLSSALHARGMWLMVDVVANHQAPMSDPSSFFPFNDWAFFHDCNNCPSGCNVNNYTDLTEMEHCRLASLLDLNQTSPFVRQQLLQWIANLTNSFGIDGLRLDTVPYVWSSFWTEFQQAAGMYIVGEVFSGDVPFVAQFQGPLDALLSYPMFFTLRDVFANRASMNEIQGQTQAYAHFPDASVLGTFIDNHDNARFLNLRNDPVAYRAALTYVLFSEGIPIVYYGTEAGFAGGGDPGCREPLWPTGFAANASDTGAFLATANNFRRRVQLWAAGPQVQRYSDDTFYAFSRGDTFVALTNGGSGGAREQRPITYHPYADGTTICNLFDLSDCLTVSGGQFTVTLEGGESKVYDPSITRDSGGIARNI